jgi:hypothetical protein
MFEDHPQSVDYLSVLFVECSIDMKNLILFSLCWCCEWLQNGISSINLLEVILADLLGVVGLLEVVLVEFDISDVAESINYVSKELLYVLLWKILG